MADEKQLEKMVKRASKSLLEYIQKGQSSSGKSSLFDAGDVLSGQTVQLIVGLKKIPEQGKAKPITLPIPHSLYSPDSGASMCMFVKDNSEELKKKLEADPVDGLERVISLSALRRNYKEYSDRRKLVASHDLFLGWGACCSVKVGRTDFTPKQVAENTMAAIRGLIQKVPRKWKNIQSMHLKSTESIALPIYNALPQVNAAMADMAEEEEEEAVVESTTSKKTKTKGKKSSSKSSKRARDTKEEEVAVKKSNKKQKTKVSARFDKLKNAEKDSKKVKATKSKTKSKKK